MSDIYEIRRRNLRLLVDEHANGNLARFVEVTLRGAMSYKVLQRTTSLTTGPRKRRNLGSMLARRIEVQLRLPRGWMDHDRSGAIQTGPVLGGRSERVVRVAESIESLSVPQRVVMEDLVALFKTYGAKRGAA